MRWRVEQKHLELVAPTLTELRDQSTAEVRELWDAASALASWRTQKQELLRDTLASIEHAPWDHVAIELDLRPDALEAQDMARALVALRPERFPSLAGDTLTAATTRWRAVLSTATAMDMPIESTWGRRWARFLRPTIDLVRLMCSLPWRTVRALAKLSEPYSEGTMTAEEARHALMSVLAERGCLGARLEPVWMERSPHRGQLEALLRAGPGAILLGEAGTGRRATLEELRGQHAAGGIAPDLRRYGFNVDNFHGYGGLMEDGLFIPPAAVDTRMIYGLTQPFVEPDPTMTALLTHCAELALNEAAEFRLVLCLDEAGWGKVRVSAPALERLPILRFERIPDQDLLPLWLCQRPFLEDLFGVQLDLAALLARLDETSVRTKLSEAGDLIRRDVMPELHSWLPPRRPPLAWLRSAGAGRARTRLIRRLPWLEALVPGDEQMSALVRLDALLSGEPGRA